MHVPIYFLKQVKDDEKINIKKIKSELPDEDYIANLIPEADYVCDDSEECFSLDDFKSEFTNYLAKSKNKILEFKEDACDIYWERTYKIFQETSDRVENVEDFKDNYGNLRFIFSGFGETKIYLIDKTMLLDASEFLKYYAGKETKYRFITSYDYHI